MSSGTLLALILKDKVLDLVTSSLFKTLQLERTGIYIHYFGYKRMIAPQLPPPSVVNKQCICSLYTHKLLSNCY